MERSHFYFGTFFKRMVLPSIVSAEKGIALSSVLGRILDLTVCWRYESALLVRPAISPLEQDTDMIDLASMIQVMRDGDTDQNASIKCC